MQPIPFLALALLAAPQDPPCELTGTDFALGLPGGTSALSGDTYAFAGNPGEVFVYVDDGSGWAEQQELAVPNTAVSLALDGDTLLVGLQANDDMAMDAGAAQVFVRNAGIWSLEQTIYADTPAVADRFGSGVALAGDRAFIGADGRDPSGVVYEYERNAGVWSEVDVIVPGEIDVNARFGGSIAISGDTLLVAEYAGDVWVFVDSGGGWAEQANLPLPAGVSDSISVDTAIDGDFAIVGQRTMGAFVFARSGSAWTQEASFSPPEVFFTPTISVAIEGNVAVVAGNSGPRIHVRAGGGTWSELAVLTPFVAGLFDRYDVTIEDGRVLSANRQPSVLVREYDVPAFLAPEIAHRNAGTNPDSYTSTPGYVGKSLHFTVDLTTTGHDMALVIGFDSPFGITLGGGQTLLCLDLLGSGGELINTGFHPGPVAETELAVPNDLSFAGFTVCTQAVHAFGVVPFALSNAQDIVIGACFP